MRVGWVSPTFPTPIGGAEMADRDMKVTAPEGVEIVDIDPFDDMPLLESCDRVVITRLPFSPPQEAVERLLAMEPVCRSWGIVPRVVGLHHLFTGARAYMAASDLHWRADSEWVECSRVLISPGYRNLETIDEVNREFEFHARWNRVVWAHRMVGHKGLDLAVEWAQKNDRWLHAMFNAPYLCVLEAVRKSTHFILLSKIIDAAPFAVIEAQLLGCELIVNSLVGGWFDGSIRERVESAPSDFWGLVIDDRIPENRLPQP